MMLGSFSRMLAAIVFFLCCSITYVASDENYSIVLSSNGPIIRGGVARFKAEALYRGNPAKGQFKYEWSDSSMKGNTRTFKTGSNVDTWNITYAANEYPTGSYRIQVVLSIIAWIDVYWQVASRRIDFTLTDTLNGQLVLVQNDRPIETGIVSNATVLNQTVALKTSDADYVKAMPLKSYWFVDCLFVGVSDNLTFVKSYNASDVRHRIDVVVIAGQQSVVTTTASPSTTTIVPKSVKAVTVNATAVTKTVHKRSAKNDLARAFNISLPSLCNSSVIPMDENLTYGLFSSNVTVRAPVTNISISGNNWLEHGDVLHLRVTCKGSGLFNYCLQFHSGLYNITGNETCLNPDVSEKCSFPVNRYFIDSGIQTVVIVIYNDLGRVINPVTVTVYEVQTKAQLSVIVVPVLFSAISIILIVFGVAYYMQNRTRFTVEVANFDFGRNCADMEYMTFKERLADAIANAFTRAPSRSGSEEPVWPPGKYGSMP